jgi:glycosyltransferase involved in cell wall biosynthesis
MKFALVSHALPPSPYVQSLMIYRLLHGLDADDYCLITQGYGTQSAINNSLGEKLPARHYYMSRWLNMERGVGFGAVRWSNVMARALQIARVLRREKCEAVVACTSELFDLPASFIASRMAKVKFYPYLFDYYSHMATGTRGEAFANHWEPRMMKEAAGIIVPNEFLRDDLRERYNVEATVVHNPCDLSLYEGAPAYDGSLNEGDEIRIGYTGSIYHAHYSAFWNLLAAIESLNERNIKLHIYSNQTPELLAEKGVRGPLEINEPVPPAAIPQIQLEADLLFLPLAFNAPHPGVIRTSAPGKMGEYLASGRPVLVHVPEDSFPAWYFRHYECGMVVTDNDPGKVAQAIEVILTDKDLRRKLVRNAWERAQSDFGIPASQRAFANLMKLEV